MSMTLKELEDAFQKADLTWQTNTKNDREMIITGIKTDKYEDQDGDKGVVVLFILEENNSKNEQAFSGETLKGVLGSFSDDGKYSLSDLTKRLTEESKQCSAEYDAIHVRTPIPLYKWTQKEFHKNAYAMNDVNRRIKFASFAWDQRDGEVMYSYNISLDDKNQKLEPKSIRRLLSAISDGVDYLAEQLGESADNVSRKSDQTGRLIAQSSTGITSNKSVDTSQGSASEISNEGLI